LPVVWSREAADSHESAGLSPTGQVLRHGCARCLHGIEQSTWTGQTLDRKRRRNYRKFRYQKAVTCDYDLHRGKGLAMRIRHIRSTAIVAAFAALASTLSVTPPAAADCISARGPDPVVVCSQGESRKSNTSPVPRSTPYIPVDCDMDWLCNQGLGIALND